MRENSRKKRASESVESRQKRLASQSKYQKDKIAMNLWNADNRDWQSNVSISQKKLQINLLEVDKRDLQSNVSIRKKKTANESVGGRQKRLAKQREYQKEKTANEYNECRQRKETGKQTSVSGRKKLQMNLLNVEKRDC